MATDYSFSLSFFLHCRPAPISPTISWPSLRLHTLLISPVDGSRNDKRGEAEATRGEGEPRKRTRSSEIVSQSSQSKLGPKGVRKKWRRGGEGGRRLIATGIKAQIVSHRDERWACRSCGFTAIPHNNLQRANYTFPGVEVIYRNHSVVSSSGGRGEGGRGDTGAADSNRRGTLTRPYNRPTRKS